MQNFGTMKMMFVNQITYNAILSSLIKVVILSKLDSETGISKVKIIDLGLSFKLILSA